MQYVLCSYLKIYIGGNVLDDYISYPLEIIVIVISQMPRLPGGGGGGGGDDDDMCYAL